MTEHMFLKSSHLDKYLQALHAEFPDAIWITGGAVGLDTWAAMFAMQHSIPLWLILPFPPLIMTKFWNARKIGHPIRLFNSF